MDSQSNKPDQLESALRSLSPRKSAIDRDRLLYLAGQASAAPERPGARGMVWRVLTCASSVAAVVLATLMFVRKTPEAVVIEKIVYVNRPSVDAAAPKPNQEQKPAPQLVRKPANKPSTKPNVDLNAGNWQGAEFVSARTLRLRHPAMSLNVEQLPGTDYSFAETPTVDSTNLLRGSQLPLRQQKSEPQPSLPFFGLGQFPFQFSWGKSDEL